MVRFRLPITDHMSSWTRSRICSCSRPTLLRTSNPTLENRSA